MACSCCGGKIRRLAQQYQYMSAKSTLPKETPAEKKARLQAALNFSTIVEETESKHMEQIEDDSVIHTE